MATDNNTTAIAEAELILRATDIVVIQNKINELLKVDDEALTEPELDALYGMQHGLIDLCTESPPTTLAGARALAVAAIAIAPPGIDGKPSWSGGDSQWLAWLVVKFLAAGDAV
jgi:hypothetical protein